MSNKKGVDISFVSKYLKEGKGLGEAYKLALKEQKMQEKKINIATNDEIAVEQMISLNKFTLDKEDILDKLNTVTLASREAMGITYLAATLAKDVITKQYDKLFFKSLVLTLTLIQNLSSEDNEEDNKKMFERTVATILGIDIIGATMSFLYSGLHGVINEQTIEGFRQIIKNSEV